MRTHYQFAPLLCLGLVAATSSVATSASQGMPIERTLETRTIASRTKPLANLIAKGEGDWDSVNRGRAGDTPGGIRSITGKSFSQMTVAEVMQLQGSQVFAVGRYQFIPSTLRQAVAFAGVNTSHRFDWRMQDRLFAAILLHKRPAVAEYLRGGGDLQLALDSLAHEWASVSYRGGGSYYGGRGGNQAHITVHEATVALNRGRAL